MASNIHSFENILTVSYGRQNKSHRFSGFGHSDEKNMGISGPEKKRSLAQQNTSGGLISKQNSRLNINNCALYLSCLFEIRISTNSSRHIIFLHRGRSSSRKSLAIQNYTRIE